MTTKEAIKLIQGIEEDGRNVTAEHIEALDLAIKALRRVDCIYVKDECFAACGESGTCEAEEEGGTDG